MRLRGSAATRTPSASWCCPAPTPIATSATSIDSQYADKTGALVFACLLHLAGDSSGARFWWRFAAGVGHLVAEYCLFLEHAHSGEYYDTHYWRGQLLRHHFEPTYMCGDRADAPQLAPELIGQVHPHITRSDHPEIGTAPLPARIWSRTCATSPPCCSTTSPG